VQRNATIENQYRIATQAAGLLARADRGLLDVTGRDRAAWLHNLVTNAVKTLQPGEGNYAFATNIKGRTVFDLNLLVLEDRIWLDIDRRWIDAARKHLTKYIITEDVTLADISKDWERLAIVGPAAAEVIGRMGFGNLAPMAQLQHISFTWDGHPGRLVRNDFLGLPGAELLVAPADVDSLLSALLDAGRPSGLARIDAPTAEILRIEAGRPASVTDIDEDVVPPETGQIERGISYHKGCYLGQEVIERMRSHGVIARKLVGVRLEGETGPACPAPIAVEGAESGRLTSVCWSYLLDSPLGLGYVRSAHATAGLVVNVAGEAGPVRGQIVTLPVRPA
jgi:folate-binding protein YgfZ